MPLFDLSDQSYVRVPPTAVRADPAGPVSLSAWVPALGLETVADRDDEGVLWRAQAVTGAGRSAVRWRGTAEVWLEPWHDGTVVHLYVRLDPLASPVPARRVERMRSSLVRRWKQRMQAWRWAVDGDRVAGT